MTTPIPNAKIRANNSVNEAKFASKKSKIGLTDLTQQIQIQDHFFLRPPKHVLHVVYCGLFWKITIKIDRHQIFRSYHHFIVDIS